LRFSLRGPDPPRDWRRRNWTRVGPCWPVTRSVPLRTRARCRRRGGASSVPAGVAAPIRAARAIGV